MRPILIPENRGLSLVSPGFPGEAGTKRGSGDWEISFRFAASPNVTGLAVGDITGINKKDSHYLWVPHTLRVNPDDQHRDVDVRNAPCFQVPEKLLEIRNTG